MKKHYKYHYKHGVTRVNVLRNSIVIATSFAVLGLSVLPAVSSYLFRVEAPTAKLSANQQPVPHPVLEEEQQPRQLATPMPWPSYGSAAYGVPEEKLFAESERADDPVAIASLAKIITVLAILQQKPLDLGEQGPTITLDNDDVELVNMYARKSGTYTPVVNGQKITQYQALQSIMMVSSNNMADSLVRWAFGSMDNYIIYANKMLKDIGLEDTVVADDASGYSPNTVSTAKDMVQLGRMYMQNPVLREIAMQKRATVPVAGVIANNNSSFNEDGIIGIKFGFTEEAGKTFVAASVHKDAKGQETISVAAVLGAGDYYTAVEDAKAILRSGDKGHKKLDG
jgi:serine-type D-Ala-D-Ala carboxypeptidase (penicillin-binding protein 5/6)